ncbi:MAG: hypothetical protein AB7P21_15310 [Lautropia sp.]
MIRKGLPLLALVMIGGCGGGNSDSAVSANAAEPPATTTTSATSQESPAVPPAQAPTTISAGTPATAPAPTPDPSNPPAPATATGASVPGAIVFAALKAGIADNPADRSPYSSGCRRVVSAPAADPTATPPADPAPAESPANGATTTGATTTDASTTTVTTTPTAPAPAAPATAPAPVAFYLCGAMRSYQVTGGFPGASGIGASAVVAVEPIVNGDTVFGVTANGLRLDGPALDLSTVDPQVDATIGRWTAGDASAHLVVSSVPGSPRQMRVCWNVNLPPPPPVTGPPGFEPIVRLERFKRLMCGVYDRLAIGADQGGYVVDDIGGRVSVSEGSW